MAVRAVRRQRMIPAWWGRGGPGKAVQRAAESWDAAESRRAGTEKAGARLMARHMADVWGTARAAQGLGARRGADIEFAARVARHVVGCRACSGDGGLALWAVAYPRLAVDDVVKPLR